MRELIESVEPKALRERLLKVSGEEAFYRGGFGIGTRR
jgi:hypothetical protein